MVVRACWREVAARGSEIAGRDLLRQKVLLSFLSRAPYPFNKGVIGRFCLLKPSSTHHAYVGCGDARI